jgi:thiamine biosynthesis lipoprotein
VALKEFTLERRLMGSAFVLGVVAADADAAERWLLAGEAEIMRIEALLTEFNEGSVTHHLNTGAGQREIEVPEEVIALIKRCNAISDLTSGCFDISIGALKPLYRFKNQQFAMPPQSEVRMAMRSVGYRHILLNERKNTVRFDVPGLRISFAAIGKGYASDRVRHMWRQMGVESGFVNASGDLATFGSRADGSPWNVAIVDPNGTRAPLLHVPMNDASVATSGDSEQHFIWNSKRWSHNIDPRTGMPVCGIASATVFSPSAELSDALATATHVMGLPDAISFIGQLPRTHAIIVDADGRIHQTEHVVHEMA